MALYSKFKLPSLVCLNPQNPQRGTLIYVLGIIILVDGILVIDGIGIILCTLVSVSMILFCFCVGWCGRYPVFIPGTLICGIMLSGLWCILLGLVAVR